MPGFNTVPGSASGGGQPNLSFIGSIYLETFARTWAQGGTAGYYGVYSGNQENGYAYFVGNGVTSGIPLNKMSNVSHAFNSINIIGSAGDLVTLYKVKVKSTTAYAQGNADFPYSSQVSGAASVITTTQQYSMPSNALSLANVLIVGGGGSSGAGHGGAHGGGGGGGGGNVIKLTGIQPPVPIQVTIGQGAPQSPSNNAGYNGGTTYFGNFYALGGGGGGGWDTRSGQTAGNGGGAGAGGTASGGPGIVQGAASGLGTAGLLPPAFFGGNKGGDVTDSSTGTGRRGGGGGGAGAQGGAGSNGSGGNGGSGYTSDITGSNIIYAPGGYGYQPDGGTGAGWSGSPYGAGGQGNINGYSSGSGQIGNPGNNGVVIVRYYTT